MHQTKKKLHCTLRYRNNIKLNCWRVCCCSGCIFNTRIIIFCVERKSHQYEPPKKSSSATFFIFQPCPAPSTFIKVALLVMMPVILRNDNSVISSAFPFSSFFNKQSCKHCYFLVYTSLSLFPSKIPGIDGDFQTNSVKIYMIMHSIPYAAWLTWLTGFTLLIFSITLALQLECLTMTIQTSTFSSSLPFQ